MPHFGAGPHPVSPTIGGPLPISGQQTFQPNSAANPAQSGAFGFLEGIEGFEGFSDLLERFNQDFTGQTGADAAIAAALQQAQLGQQAIGQERTSLGRFNALLDPFEQSGQGALGKAQGLFGNLGFSKIAQDPAFQAQADRNTQNVLNRASAGGRVGAGGTVTDIRDSTARLGSDFLSQQRGDLLTRLQGGQQAAAQQANQQIGSGQRISDILTGIGNAQAAGAVGAQNARSGGTQNVLGLLATLLGGIT